LQISESAKAVSDRVCLKQVVLFPANLIYNVEQQQQQQYPRDAIRAGLKAGVRRPHTTQPDCQSAAGL
jgi:hypothetical protein